MSADLDGLVESVLFPYSIKDFFFFFSLLSLSQTFRIKPPMCITKKDVDFAVEVFDTALQRHMERAAAKQT